MIEQLIFAGGAEPPFTPPAAVAGKAYQSFVPADDLISGSNLSALLALTSGGAMNDKAGWLKYIDNGKTFYIARKPLRYGVTVAAYKAAGLLVGKNISIGGQIYKVRLMSGMSVDPFASIISNGGGGEWEQYMYPIYAAADRPAADVWSYYTAADLGLTLDNSLAGDMGTVTVCKDQHNSITTALAARGWDYSGGTSLNPIARRTVINDASVSEGNGAGTLNVYGFRPLLEYIGEAPPADLYYGEVLEADLISAPAFSALVGMSAIGSVTNASSNWLKYRYLGKTVYMSKKPLRHAMTWEQLDTLGLTKGQSTFTFGGKGYTVRLPTGAAAEPSYYNIVATGGSFNDLIYPVYGGVSLAQPEVQAYPRWAAFTDAELGFGTDKNSAAGGIGTLNWCQELVVGNASRLVRGYNDADNAGIRQILTGWYIALNGTQTYAGWRPIIEELADSAWKWAKAGSISPGLMNMGVATVGGKLYTYGGDPNNGSSPVGPLKMFDPATGVWTNKSAGPPARTWHCMCEGGDGFIYVFSGYNSSGQNAELWRYDPVADSWVQKASDTITRYDGNMTYYNGKLYVVGGYTNGYASDLRCYDIATNTWSGKASYTGGRRHMTLSAVDGKLYMTGGNVGGTESWVYDIAGNAWTQLPDHPMGNISQHRSVVLNGKIYYHGGVVGGTQVKKTWVYDPVAASWATAADGPIIRAVFSMLAIGDRAYIIGGLSAGVVQSDVAVFKP
jgi:N-acetylneuraminic acid mutarotase